jgi:flagellar biosynthetic protein FliO
MGVLLQTAQEVPGGYGVVLLQTLFALAGVCVLAWVVLRWGARRGLGMGALGGRVRVLERIALEPRRALYVVKVGERVLLLGAGDGGSPTLITEIDPATLPPEEARKPTGEAFRDVLARVTGKAKPPAE